MTILICHQPGGSTILESPSFILCRNWTEHILKSPLLWRVTGASVGAACFSKLTRHTSLSTYWQTEFGCPIGQFHAEMDSTLRVSWRAINFTLMRGVYFYGDTVFFKNIILFYFKLVFLMFLKFFKIKNTILIYL
jgi:hypothetical protein